MLLISLTISGCVGFDFWFERLPALAAWEVDRWFDLDSDQEERLEQSLEPIHEWLRSRGVPQALDALNAAIDSWKRGQLDQTSQILEDRSKALWEQALVANWSSITAFLDTLKPENIRHYRQMSEEKMDDWFEGSETRERKIEKRMEQSEGWIGDLDEKQRRLYAEHVVWEASEARLRRENSRHRRKQMTRMVLDRDYSSLREALLDPRQVQLPQFLEWRDAEEQRTRSLITALNRTLNEEQRQAVLERLELWRDRLGEVDPQG